MKLIDNILMLGWMSLWLMQASFAASAPVDSYPLKAEPVRANVYAIVSPHLEAPNPHNQGWMSNVAFVVGRDGVLLFDTGSSEAIGRAIVQAVRAVTDKPIRWVVNSHEHGDHWLGNAGVAGLETPIYASVTAAANMRKEGSNWVGQFKELTGGATGESALRLPDQIIQARRKQMLSDIEVEFIPVGPAHSPGDMVVWLPQAQVLLAADVLFNQRLPVTFDSDLANWMKILKDVLEPLQPLAVVPGHGPVGDLATLQAERRYFETLWQQVTVLQQQGKQDFEIAAQVRQMLPEYRRQYPDFDTQIGNSISHFYLQVERASFAP